MNHYNYDGIKQVFMLNKIHKSILWTYICDGLRYPIY